MDGAVVKVVEVSWTIGMGRPTLASQMQGTIDRLNKEGLGCVGVERVTEWHWLMFFAAAD